MIATIELPLRATNTITGHDVLVIAVYVPIEQVGQVSHSKTPRVIYVTDDGSLGEAEIGEVNINWRFNEKTRRWVDVDTGEDLETNDDGESSNER